MYIVYIFIYIYVCVYIYIQYIYGMSQPCPLYLLLLHQRQRWPGKDAFLRPRGRQKEMREAERRDPHLGQPCGTDQPLE